MYNDINKPETGDPMPFRKIDINAIIQEKLKDETFRLHYEQFGREYELIESIVRIRKAKNISQVELAKRVHVSQQAISRLEKEKHIPKIDTLMKIVDGLGMKLTLTEK
jgi:DNA-binding XRE family transcriptional regulator